jgi:hypothetical protein
MTRRNAASFGLLVTTTLILLFSLVVTTRADESVPGEFAAGQGLGSLPWCYGIDGPPSFGCMGGVSTIIDPCGNSDPEGNDGVDWTPGGSGTYTICATVEDESRNTAMGFFTVFGKGAGGGSCSSCGGTAGFGADIGLDDGVSMLFHMGTTTYGKSVGALWVHEQAATRWKLNHRAQLRGAL